MNLVVRSTSVPISELCSPRGQVTFPVAWHCPVVGFGGALGDHALGADELVGPARKRGLGGVKSLEWG